MMVRKLRMILALALVLAMLVCAGACAELARGSSGEEVESLQNMLYDMGYLFEEPDGQFGGKTEAAVKEYQQSTGWEMTGVVTDDLMEEISQDWIEYWNWVEEQLRLDGELIGDPDAVSFCSEWENAEGRVEMELCQRHALLWETTQEMLGYGDADSAEYSFYEWQAEIISLYNELSDLVSEPVRAQLEANKALCIQLMGAQKQMMFDAYDAAGVEMDPTDVYYGAELWMRNHAAWLCQMLSTVGAE